MLPFLKNKEKAIGGTQTIFRKPDSEESKPESFPGLEACAQAMIQAMDGKDSRALAQALKDAFCILESMPHQEYSNIQGDSE